jgi:hypothetical protein
MPLVRDVKRFAKPESPAPAPERGCGSPPDFLEANKKTAIMAADTMATTWEPPRFLQLLQIQMGKR